MLCRWVCRWMVLALLACVFGSQLAGCGDSGGTVTGGQLVTVYAAASTTDALSDVAEAFTVKTGVPVVTSFAASSTVARQIVAGAPADVFLSANPKWMQVLEDEGRVLAGCRQDLLGNRLVLVTPLDSSLTVSREPGFDILGSFDGRLAVGDPAHVPVGMYAREALEKLGWWSGLEPRLARAATTRAGLRFVETGECELGIVYATDAAASKKVRVAGMFPETLHPPIRYPIATIGTGSEAAKAFVAFAASPEGIEIFMRHGFSAAPTEGGQP